MKLALAANYFCNNVIDGWNGTGWVSAIGAGMVQVYDRFVSDRSFGQQIRILLVPSPIASAYTCIKIAGRVYMLQSSNPDIQHDEIYSNVYIIHEAPYLVDVLREVEGTTRASGVTERVTTTVATGIPGNLDRYSWDKSGQNQAIRYGVYTLFMPRGSDLLNTDMVRIGGEDYVVKERANELDLEYARVVKRSLT